MTDRTLKTFVIGDTRYFVGNIGEVGNASSIVGIYPESKLKEGRARLGHHLHTQHSDRIILLLCEAFHAGRQYGLREASEGSS